jgi:hypothetical protein
MRMQEIQDRLTLRKYFPGRMLTQAQAFLHRQCEFSHELTKAGYAPQGVESRFDCHNQHRPIMFVVALL